MIYMLITYSFSTLNSHYSLTGIGTILAFGFLGFLLKFALKKIPEDIRIAQVVHTRDCRPLVAEFAVTCPTADLQKARFVKGLFAPKGLLYYPANMPTHVDLEKAITRAIKKTCFVMLKTPVPFIGVRAIDYLANRIQHLQRKSSEPQYAMLYIGTIVRMQEEIGTGGGGFRFIYASFLQEAANKLNEPRLQECSDLMTQSGDAWREFALLGARFCKRRSEVTLDQLADAMRLCAKHEYDAFRLLRSIRL